MKNPYDAVRFRGHKFDARTRAAILALEARLGRRVTIYQGSYTGQVSVSGGTHLGGGAVDLWVNGMDADTVTRAARKVGWAMWWRTPAQGPWGHHQHGILREHRTASPAAHDQVDGPNGFDHGGDGLADTSGDPQPWRPDPPVTFHYWDWVRAQTLRSRLRDLSRSIAALKDRRRSVKKRLSKLS